jgi:hypothetical protein
MNQANASTNLDNQQAQLVAQNVQAARLSNLQQMQRYDFFRKAVLDTIPANQGDNASGDPSNNGGSSAPWWSTPPQSGSSSAAPSSMPAPAGGAAPGAPATGGDDPDGPPTPPSAPMGTLPGTPDHADGDLGDSVFDHGRVDAGLRARYFVNPAGTPAEQQFLGDAALSGDKSLIDLATQRRNLGVESRKAQSERDAGEMFDHMQAVATAPSGLAMDALDAIAPQLSTAIRKKYPGDPAAMDEAARDSAAHIGASVHQYSGRELVADTGGTYRDKASGAPVLGVPHAGMTQEQFSTLWDKASELVSVKNSDGSESQVPRWKAAGAQSQAAYVHQAGDAWRAAAMYPSAAQTRLGIQQGKLNDMSPRVAIINGLSQPGGQPGAAPQPGAPAAPADPVLRQALTDPEYKLQVPPVIRGTSQTPAQAEQAKTTVQARTDLLKDSQDATSAAAQSMQYMQAAKAILDSKQVPTTGAYGGLIAKASALLPGQSVDASNYAEVAKYLGNAALAQAKGIYGARMTQSEVGLQLNELSPSTKMPDSAIRDLLDTNIRSAQYTINAARKSKLYLASGGDPQKYADWLESYYPRAQSVNTTQPAAPPTRPGQQTSGGQQGSAPRTIVRTGTLNGRKVVQYSDGSTGYGD